MLYVRVRHDGRAVRSSDRVGDRNQEPRERGEMGWDTGRGRWRSRERKFREAKWPRGDAAGSQAVCKTNVENRVCGPVKGENEAWEVFCSFSLALDSASLDLVVLLFSCGIPLACWRTPSALSLAYAAAPGPVSLRRSEKLVRLPKPRIADKNSHGARESARRWAKRALGDR